MRKLATVVCVVLAVVTLQAATASASPLDRVDAGVGATCGEATKFGHTFAVNSVGRETAPTCGQAQRIIDGKCKVHLKRRWSCFSFQEEDPFILWFLTKEMWARHSTQVVYYERYPCSEANVTSELFARPPLGFPSIRQLLADDIVRCELLAGQTYSQVRKLLGRPDGGKPGHYVLYVLGPERDSFFQIDPELLAVWFRKNGRYEGVDIFQG
ncbi:MAG: hypothetical protein U0R24_00505 [Solirubrobacterales bacterium]